MKLHSNNDQTRTSEERRRRFGVLVDIVTRSDFFGGVRLASFGTERAYCRVQLVSAMKRVRDEETGVDVFDHAGEEKVRLTFLEGYGSRLRIDRMEYTLVSNLLK